MKFHLLFYQLWLLQLDCVDIFSHWGIESFWL